MSSPRADLPGGIRTRGDDDRLRQPSSPSPVQSTSTDQRHESTGCSSADSASTHSAPAGHRVDAQPLPEQITQPTESPQSHLCSTPRALEQLATVEMQLCLQFLDTKNKLMAVRCSRSLLRAADHPFAWQGSTVAVSSATHPQLGSLIRQSLLRHASIALTLHSDLPAAEVAAIPRLREMIIDYQGSIDFDPQLLTLPSLQGLQTLRLHSKLPPSTMQLLPALPALHTLQIRRWDEPAHWSWLSAMPALTELDLTSSLLRPMTQRTFDAIGQCARLQSLRLRDPVFKPGVFARFCATPAMRRLRHLDLRRFTAQTAEPLADAPHSAFSTLAGLESLHLKDANGVDRLLLHLAHSPALRTLTFVCTPDEPIIGLLYGSTHPSFRMLRWLLVAAPRLEVRLEIPASMHGWRGSDGYRRLAATASDRNDMDDQWSELQGMAAEMERVTVVSG